MSGPELPFSGNSYSEVTFALEEKMLRLIDR
jgi:hypothetical protein